ncbi:unnamed protein product [Caenorhabditis angaria]|uniref:Uncharacterized protein n=1 Tax=Caenorhabditis angaria TaxID=860376 RepID=A0A9P1N7C6_9PELO|nr:unnamed protein product [Caenorhabditis angaria]
MQQQQSTNNSEEDGTKQKHKKKGADASTRKKAKKSGEKERDLEKTKRRKDVAVKKSIFNSPVKTEQQMKKEKQEGFFKSIFQRAKTSFTGKLDKSDDSFIAAPETIQKAVDVRAEYGCPEDYGMPPDKPIDSNYDNNGALFVKGRPFWCLKDEKPPPPKHCVMSTAMRKFMDKSWQMADPITEPTDLDPYHNLEYIQARDWIYMKNDKQIFSNTIRSLGLMANMKIKRSEKSEIDLDTTTQVMSKSTMTFVAANKLIQYNRKNRHDLTNTIAFTPGITKKQRIKHPGLHGKKG